MPSTNKIYEIRTTLLLLLESEVFWSFEYCHRHGDDHKWVYAMIGFGDINNLTKLVQFVKYKNILLNFIRLKSTKIDIFLQDLAWENGKNNLN